MPEQMDQSRTPYFLEVGARDGHVCSTRSKRGPGWRGHILVGDQPGRCPGAHATRCIYGTHADATQSGRVPG